MANKELSTKEIPLTGKLVTSEDPSVIGVNFQQLTNMRPTQTSIEGIGGHSKINTTVIPDPKVRSGIFFNKADESHVIVEAYDSTLATSHIYDNTTAIPNTGDFTATSLYTPLSGTGRFSEAPNGYLAYANGAETLIYGGDESDIGGFINYAPDDSFSKDQTIQVSDTITTTNGHIATLTRVARSTSDSVLLLHCENNDTDSSPSVHTLTNPNITYNVSAAKFGSYGAILNGTNANFVVPTDADFDFSGAGATWTVDGQFKVDNLTNPHPIYYKQTDANNYFGIFIQTDGSVQVSNFATGSETLNTTSGFYSATGVITVGTRHHIEVDRNGNTWYIFVDGTLQGLLVDSTDIGTETGDVLIGSDGTFFFDGDIDEYRVSSIATHTGDFEAPSAAYGDGFTTYMYAGFILPVSKIKYYVSTANTTASTSSVDYWDGSGWAPVTSYVDNTIDTGVSLAVTGALSFDSTAGVAELKEVKGLVLYWYRIKVNECDDNVSVYRITGTVPFQPIKDIWDGTPSYCLSCLKDKTTYEDYTTAIFESDYLASAASTYLDVTSLLTTESLILGFADRQLGLRINLVGSFVNATANTVASINYWNGTEWVSVGTISDGTSTGGVSFAQAGLITWNQLDDGTEFQTEFTGALETTPILYYYQIVFDKNLSAGRVDQITGVAAQKTISNYKFPLHAMNRLWLFSDQANEKNKSICSAEFTTTTFNGDDSIELIWGDEKELTGGAWIYSQYGASVYSILVVFKQNETWALIGNDAENWQQYKISSSVGCVAPETIRVVELPNDETKGINRSSAIIFQGANGIYITDGRPPTKISGDIDIFEKRKSKITNIDESFAFDDVENQEYHWCFTESTHTDKELVLNYEYMKWYYIDRPSPLQYGMEVQTTEGATYSYGFIDSYMLRLENGNNFDGTGIAQTFQFGDIALSENHVTLETDALYHNLTYAAKTNTAQEVLITHYGDSETTGNELTDKSCSKTGYRIISATYHQKEGSHIFHSWKFSITTTDETIGFEPLFFSCLYKEHRKHLKDYR